MDLVCLGMRTLHPFALWMILDGRLEEPVADRVVGSSTLLSGTILKHLHPVDSQEGPVPVHRARQRRADHLMRVLLRALAMDPALGTTNYPA